jgi:hypothetical protein
MIVLHALPNFQMRWGCDVIIPKVLRSHSPSALSVCLSQPRLPPTHVACYTPRLIIRSGRSFLPMSNATSTATKQRSKLAPPEIPPIIGRTVSGGFRTEEGTIHVSRPFRSKKSRKLRAMVSFTPRKSAFDTTNEMSGMNEFRVRRVAILHRVHMLIYCNK